MTTQSHNTPLRVIQPDTPADWNRALAQLPAPHVLQTWEWGAFKARHGWRPGRYLYMIDGHPEAAASTLTRQLAPQLPPLRQLWGSGVMYVPKGPAMDYGNAECLGRVLGHLEDLARRERALFVKIDPDVSLESPVGTAVVQTLRRRGWRPSREQIQFRNTMVIDLERSPDDVLAGMKSKWRYNVRLATRKGVVVRRGTRADLPALYEMYVETSVRGGFVIRPQDYYLDAWTTFLEGGLAQALIAEVNGEAVAMVIIYRFGKQAWYMYGASRDAHREKMPNHLLQWEAMRWAQDQGCTIYDMWGAPDELDESDPLWGVYRFKKGFGGAFVRRIGAWDFPTSRVGYWLYANVMPKLLALMRRRYWRNR